MKQKLHKKKSANIVVTRVILNLFLSEKTFKYLEVEQKIAQKEIY